VLREQRTAPPTFLCKKKALSGSWCFPFLLAFHPYLSVKEFSFDTLLNLSVFYSSAPKKLYEVDKKTGTETVLSL